MTSSDGANDAVRPAGSRKPAILVAEDEASLTTLLRYNLEKEGYRVFEGHDGEEALMIAGEESLDLVLLDWMMPKVSGIEVCRRLRGRTETRNVPIIMLTARGEEADRVRGLDTGADDYITKPFSMTELLARIRAVMRRVRPALAEDVVQFGDVSIDEVLFNFGDPGRGAGLVRHRDPRSRRARGTRRRSAIRRQHRLLERLDHGVTGLLGTHRRRAAPPPRRGACGRRCEARSRSPFC